MAKRASEMSVAELMMSRKSSLTSISAADAARASRAPPPPTPRAISREFLKEVREKLREQIGAALFSGGEDGVQVEVEARVGLYVLDGARIGKYAPGNVGVRMGSDHGGGSFESGVTARDFAHLKELLKEQKNNPYEVTKTSREIYVYSSGKSRVCVENGKISREVKTPCMQAGVHVASCPFDLRVSASYEHKDRNSALHAIPEGWDMKRSMKRTTYYRKDQLWRFDLAEVSAVKAIDPQTVILTYEVELEMDAAKFLSWMADNQTEDIAAAHNAALELWQHLNLIIALEEGSTTNLVPLEGDAQIAVQAATVAPAGNKWPKTKFPGSMPVGCGRPHVTHVQKHDYYVSEKTDGVRHWLVTAQVATAASEGGGKVVTGLVDRTLIARTMAPFVLPQQQHQQQQPQQVNMMNPLQLASDVFGAGTVIDGEVVRNHVNGRDIFMAFDLISAGDHLQHGLGEWEVEGRMIHTLPFHKRYTILRQLVER